MILDSTINLLKVLSTDSSNNTPLYNFVTIQIILLLVSLLFPIYIMFCSIEHMHKLHVCLLSNPFDFINQICLHKNLCIINTKYISMNNMNIFKESELSCWSKIQYKLNLKKLY